MLIIFLYALKLLLPVFALLAVYETTRGVLALRRGHSRLLIAKDFTTAALMLAVVVMILYIWRGHYFQWDF
jgi:hypothetical protein